MTESTVDRSDEKLTRRLEKEKLHFTDGPSNDSNQLRVSPRQGVSQGTCQN